jgi:hypothetical protein
VRTEDQVLIGDVLLALRSVEHQTVEVGYIFSGLRQTGICDRGRTCAARGRIL